MEELKEMMFEEIMEYAEDAETTEEINEVIEDVEKRWRCRKIKYEIVEEVIDNFKAEKDIE